MAAADADFTLAAAQPECHSQTFLDAGWWVVGPYPESLSTHFAPERNPYPSRPAASPVGPALLPWKDVPTEFDGHLNLAMAIGPVNHGSAYALIYVFAPRLREVIWSVTSTTWGRSGSTARNSPQKTSPGYLRSDDARVNVKLRAGRNTVLARVRIFNGLHRLIVRHDLNPLARGMYEASQGAWDRAEAEFAEAVRAPR